MADVTLMTTPDTLAECQAYCEELKAEVRRLADLAGEALGTAPSLRSSACVEVLAQHVETLRQELAANAAMLAKQCDLAREAEARAEQAARQRAEAAHGWLQQAARDALLIKQTERERDEARGRIVYISAGSSRRCGGSVEAYRQRAADAVYSADTHLRRAERERDEALARVAALEAALRPFSAAADAMDDTTGPRQGDFAIWHRTGLCEAQTTVGDCRRARAALRGEETP